MERQITTWAPPCHKLRKLCLLLPLYLLIYILIPCTAEAQESHTSTPSGKRWHTSLTFDYLFDNREYDTSPLGGSYTLNGVWLKPQVAYQLTPESTSGKQTLHLGLNALKEFGTPKVLDQLALTAYYQATWKGLAARVGIFPSDVVTDQLSERILDRRSRFYHPVMGGVQVEHKGQAHQISAWIDWLSKRSRTQRERFHAGTSLQLQHRGFFLQSHFRMMHLATSEMPNPHSTVVDDLQSETLLGYVSDSAPIGYQVAFGYYATIERDRAIQKTHKGIGLLVVYQLHWQGKVGIKGYLYHGTGHQKLRPKYSEELYFAQPLLQAPTYLQATAYWQILQKEHLTMKLELGTHLLHHTLSSHQALTCTLRLP